MESGPGSIGAAEDLGPPVSGGPAPQPTRLRRLAGEWFPTLPDADLDRICTEAWAAVRARADEPDNLAVAAAAEVRRRGLRALRQPQAETPAVVPLRGRRHRPVGSRAKQAAPPEAAPPSRAERRAAKAAAAPLAAAAAPVAAARTLRVRRPAVHAPSLPKPRLPAVRAPHVRAPRLRLPRLARALPVDRGARRRVIALFAIGAVLLVVAAIVGFGGKHHSSGPQQAASRAPVKHTGGTPAATKPAPAPRKPAAKPQAAAPAHHAATHHRAKHHAATHHRAKHHAAKHHAAKHHAAAHKTVPPAASTPPPAASRPAVTPVHRSASSKPAPSQFSNPLGP
jgi:hypothetical protein